MVILRLVTVIVALWLSATAAFAYGPDGLIARRNSAGSYTAYAYDLFGNVALRHRQYDLNPANLEVYDSRGFLVENFKDNAAGPLPVVDPIGGYDEWLRSEEEEDRAATIGRFVTLQNGILYDPVTGQGVDAPTAFIPADFLANAMYQEYAGYLDGLTAGATISIVTGKSPLQHLRGTFGSFGVNETSDFYRSGYVRGIVFEAVGSAVATGGASVGASAARGAAGAGKIGVAAGVASTRSRFLPVVRNPIHAGGHATVQMAERGGITEAMIAITIRRGEKYFDLLHNTHTYVLRGGMADGRSLVVAVNPHNGAVRTVVVPRRFNPGARLNDGTARYRKLD